MGQLIEKYIAKGINKDVAPDAIAQDGTGARLFGPGDLLDAFNCRYFSNGSDFVVKSIKGNVNRFLSLPVGENHVIGAFKNERDNTIIYLVWNSNRVDRIIEFSLQTNTFSVVLSGDLNFKRDKYIDQGGVIDGLLIWNDRVNPIRQISIQRAKDGFYATPYDINITLATVPPLVAPTCVLITDSSSSLNYIDSDTWQFAYRFIYHDDRITTFGPLSKSVYVRLIPDLSNNTKNAIDVTVTVPANLIGIVKNIDIIFRKGNTGAYFIWKTIQNVSLTTYTYRFKNNSKSESVPSDEQSRVYDYLPDVSRGLEIVKNRVFCMINTTGFDINNSLFSFSAVSEDEAVYRIQGERSFNMTVTILKPGKRYLKQGGRYGVGILFMDKFGKTSFVKQDQYIEVPISQKVTVVNSTTSDYWRNYIRWNVSGQAPDGMVKYQVVVSQNQFQMKYFQTPAVQHFYIRDINSGEQDNTQTTTTYYYRSKVFIRSTSQPVSESNVNLSYVYLQIPINVPFVPDTSCLVRDLDTGKIYPIVDVVGDFLVLRKVGYDFSRKNELLHIEVFIPSQVEDERFFEVSEIFDIVDGVFSTTTGTIFGDSYQLIFDQWEYGNMFIPGDSILQSGYIADLNRGVSAILKVPFESPTGIVSSSAIQSSSNVIYDNAVNGSNASSPRPGRGGPVSTRGITGENTATVVLYTLNYDKAAWDIGRVFTTWDNEKRRDLNTTVAFSEPYVQESFINGLNSFLADSRYSISIDRGPITCLKRAGEVLVALHERQASTMYIGEGIIRQGQDFITAKVDGVVGDDRILTGGYGCINPESVINIYEQLYWWDAYNGTVCRYTNQGIFPISNWGMRYYFADKAKKLLPYRNKVKVVTAYDYTHNEFIISFSDALDDQGNIIVPSETWVFNVLREKWSSRVAYIPEYAIGMNNNLMSFKAGQLWMHHENELCNNFYGQQYLRSWRLASNPQLGKDKRYLNIHMDGKPCVDLSEVSTFAPVRLFTKEGQESYIPAYEFTKDGLKWYAPVLCDINSPIDDGISLRSGDELLSNYLEVEFITDRTDEAPCSQVNVVYEVQEFSA
ncbi:MAG TPA: hypothetical protein VIM64_20605 [Puia sp.]